jgi:hypothetical protein
VLFAASRRAAERVPADDRSAVEPALLREYDGFGPWLAQVRSADEMPRLFREHYPRHAGARFLLKFPIFADRRMVRPGQDLYRTILAVHEDHASLLSFDGAEVSEARIDADALAAVRNYTCLLHGELFFHVDAGRVLTLPYNVVSQRLVDAVVDHLRTRMVGVDAGRLPTAAAAVADFYFRNLVDEHARRNTASVVVFCEDPGRRFQDRTGLWSVAPGLLVLDSGRELTFISRGRGVREGGALAYATERTHVPHRVLVGHEIVEVTRSRWRKRRVLRLWTAGHRFEMEICSEAASLRVWLDEISAGRMVRAAGASPAA